MIYNSTLKVDKIEKLYYQKGIIINIIEKQNKISYFFTGKR